MTLSMPSLLAGAPVSLPAGQAGSRCGTRVAGGPHEGFLDCLAREQARPEQEAQVPQAAPRQPAVPDQAPVTPILAPQGLTAAPVSAVPADTTPNPGSGGADETPVSGIADPVLSAQDNDVQRSSETPPDPSDGAVPPDPAVPGNLEPKVASPQADAAPPRTRALAKAAEGRPEAEPATAGKQTSQPEVIAALPPLAAPDPARGNVALAAKPGTAREGVIGQGKAAPTHRGEGQAAPLTARARPEGIALAPAGPSPAVPDAPASAMPAPMAMPQDAARTAATAPAVVTSTVMTDRADWPQTVVSATLATLSPDGGTMTLEMSPEELGALRITLTLEGDTASVSIQTETPEAARLLNAAEPQLAQDFARQGVTLSTHDAQTGRRGDPGPHTPGHAARPADDTPPSDPAPLLRPQGLVNLIA